MLARLVGDKKFESPMVTRAIRTTREMAIPCEWKRSFRRRIVIGNVTSGWVRDGDCTFTARPSGSLACLEENDQGIEAQVQDGLASLHHPSNKELVGFAVRPRRLAIPSKRRSRVLRE